MCLLCPKEAVPQPLPPLFRFICGFVRKERRVLCDAPQAVRSSPPDL